MYEGDDLVLGHTDLAAVHVPYQQLHYAVLITQCRDYLTVTSCTVHSVTLLLKSNLTYFWHLTNERLPLSQNIMTIVLTNRTRTNR